MGVPFLKPGSQGILQKLKLRSRTQIIVQIEMLHFVLGIKYKVEETAYLGISYFKYISIKLKEDIKRLLEVPYLGIIPRGT